MILLNEMSHIFANTFASDSKLHEGSLEKR